VIEDFETFVLLGE